MARGGRLVSETQADSQQRWALGRVHLGVLQPAPQLAGGGTTRVLFHGDLHNEQELQSELEKLGEPRVLGAAAIVGALYRRRGTQLANLLKGSFCAAVLDETTGDLLLVTDRLGSYPLYWFKEADRF